MDTKKLILFSMLDRIIIDDLLYEKELGIFEQKKEWHDMWRRQAAKKFNLEGMEGFLDWEGLKERVVPWLRHQKADCHCQDILQKCRVFKPYGQLPGYHIKEPDKIKASPEAREVTLEKICRLLGLEDEWQELFP